MATPCELQMINKQYVQNKESQKYSPMKTGIKYEMRKTCVTFSKKNKNITCRSIGAMEKIEGIGKMVKDGLVYRQSLMVRSFEIGFDSKLSITALMNYLQDTALNHGRLTGLLGDGEDFGITKQMCTKDLIWVLSSLQLVVDQYPSWLDVVEIETWMYPSGQNGVGHDWTIRDRINGQFVAQASSVFVLMNKETRKLSKFIKEVREELAPHMMNYTPNLDKITPKFPKIDIDSTDFARTGLRPGWDDLDVNQHVNYAKYINWILESVPRSLMKYHQLSALSLKYRRECDMESELHSLSKIVKKANANNQNQTIELEHLLRLHNGHEIVGGHSIWKPRHPNSST